VRISLLHNEDAGDGQSSAGLKRLIERAGHEVIHLLEDESDLHDVLDDSPDLVVAAGGDGTVWRAVSALTGQPVPLAVLPLGTANNVARSLGVTGSIEDEVARWASAPKRPFDIGVATGSWGERRFIESIGSGLISSGICAMDREDPPEEEEDTRAKLARAVRRYREVLATSKPRRCTIAADEVRPAADDVLLAAGAVHVAKDEVQLTADSLHIEGDFLLIEVHNICAVGPNLVLAPDADPSDGWFDLVVAGEEQRRELDHYLERRMAGAGARLALPRWRIRRVKITGWEEMHVDDEVVSGPPIGTASIAVDPASVYVLDPSFKEASESSRRQSGLLLQ
jgi:diacylglycerol kinase (ATP)